MEPVSEATCTKNMASKITPKRNSSDTMSSMIKNLHEQKREKEENDKIARLLRPYATFLVKYPGAMVGITILVVILSAVLAIVPATGAKDYPDFSEPNKGFSARGTKISSRHAAFFNLQKKVKGYSTVRERRAVIDNIADSLANDFIFVYKSPNDKGNLMNAMSDLCVWYEENIEVLKAENTQITTQTNHLPNYIALLNNHANCSMNTDIEISDFFTLTKLCSQYFKNNYYQDCLGDQTKCLKIGETTCRSHNNVDIVGKTKEQAMSQFMYNIFFYLTDTDFVNNPDFLKYTSSLSYMEYNEDFYQIVYDKHLTDLSGTKQGNIQVAAFRFWNFKFKQFQGAIVVQSLFIVTAVLVVIFLIWFYTASIFIGLMTIACVLIATVITYFVYGRVFDMDFFPFLNMVTTIFIVGIGADDAFVYTGMWEEAKRIYPIKCASDHIDYMIKWTTHTLRHALLAMFVTSLTTGSAFYANISSSVTSVKCFGLYSGTAIINMYLLMVTFFPAVVILHEKYLARCMHAICPGCCNTRPRLHDDTDSLHLANDLTTTMEMNQIGKEMSTSTQQPPNMMKRFQHFLDQLSDKIFKRFLPTAIIKLRYVWVVFFTCIGIAGIVITFIKPGLEPPTTESLQLFRSSNSLEQYESTYKRKFRFGTASNDGTRTVYFAFGVKEVDNGNKFKPFSDDRGSLEFYEDYLNLAEQQVWLKGFCQNLLNASFISSTSYSQCNEYLDMVTRLTSPCTFGQTECCGHTFPLPHDDFDQCFSSFLSGRSSWVLFDDNNNVKAIFMEIDTLYPVTDQFDANEKFFDEMDAWFSQQKEAIKTDNFKGFWYSEQQFYDLQLSLQVGTKESLGISIAVAFVVIICTTLNIVLALYSIITITFIISVTVGILILAGWKLNIMESIVFSVAAGLSADFTLHYSVAYKTSLLKSDRVERVKTTLLEIGPAILMGAVTTFIAGVAMAPSSVLVYLQMAQFLMLVMFISWLLSTLFFLPLCAVIGPVGKFGQFSCCKSKKKNGGLHDNCVSNDDSLPKTTNDASAPPLEGDNNYQQLDNAVTNSYEQLDNAHVNEYTEISEPS